ncbi:MAG: hypothetical protein HYY24_27370 [Verrucomicrobia bacterium]|nr:hypothetical protein [Verrucomicrobiota bacterium]
MTPNTARPRLRPGDLVEVRTAGEILATLDANASLDDLPFMPEMLDFCGKRFRVVKRVEQFCTDGAPVATGESRVRSFRNDDVVLLEDVRCSGLQHDGCKRGCMIFWKEAWLRKVEEPSSPLQPASDGVAELRARLRISSGPGIYFCQSSELLKATNHLSGRQRIGNCFSGVLVGNYRLLEMAKLLAVWTWSRVRQRVAGVWPRGRQKSTPAESLDLQPGEWVEVKPLEAIIETLDERGKNRGLHFSADMVARCGRQYRVRCRTDKLIAEGTGKVRQLRNTVILEGAVCDSSYYAFGGCPRGDFQYWREIWLRRVPTK